jgi:hypothetical protein
MRHIQNPLHLLLCLVLMFPSLHFGQSDFQKVVRHQGQADYLFEAEVYDTFGVIALGKVMDSIDRDLLVQADYAGNLVYEKAVLSHPTTTLTMTHMCVMGYDIFATGEAVGDTAAAMIYQFTIYGHLNWTRMFSHYPAPCTLTSIAANESGYVFFGGQEKDSLLSAQGMVGKIRGNDGAPMWTRVFDDSLEFDVPVIAATPAGDIVAAGHARNFSTIHFPWVAKWDANGNLLWFKRLMLDGEIKSVKADHIHVYVGGVNNQSSQLFVGQLSHAGDVMKWATLANPNHETAVADMKLSYTQVRLAGYCDETGIGESGLLMRLDSNLVPVYAWKDHFAMPYAVAGTDDQDMLHFVGGYYGDSQHPECILLGAIPDMALPAPPCGMTGFTPIFDNTLPTVVNYPVTISNRVQQGSNPWTAYSIPLNPVTDCGTATGVKESPEILDAGGIRVWPNPVTGICHVSLPERECEVACMDLQGKVVLRATGSGQVELDMGHLPGGIYMMVVERGDERWTRRVCKVV